MKKVKKKIKKMLFWKPWVSGLVIGLVLALGITASAITIDGSVDEIRALFTQEREEQSLGGNLTATGGIQDASAPVVTANNWDFYDLDVTNRLAVDGNTTLTGTSTIVKSYDGFVIGNSELTVATTSAGNLYSNTTTGTSLLCRANSAVYATSSALFTPGINLSIGTSTVSGAASTNLLSTTTIATTTGIRVLPITYTGNFILKVGEFITYLFGDYVSTASTTYYSSIDITPLFDCTMIGG